MTIKNKHLPKILIVDDRPENQLAMKKMLSKIEAELICADSGNTALTLTLQHQFALCLLDVMMPNIDGFETAELMRQNDATEAIPIIFVTAMDKSDKHLFLGYERGAVDYLYIPIIKEILLAKVRVFLDLESRQQELREANKCIIEQNQLLKSRASRDGLTELYNHVHFQNLFNREFDLAKRHYNELTVLMCDLDYFKDVNDTYGHQTGDLVLREFAALLKNKSRDTDLLARYGGEEFIMALPNTNLQGGIWLAEKIRSLAEAHIYRHGKNSIQTTVSIGVSTLGHNKKQAQELIEQADSALYKAKATGRNRVVNFQELQECRRVKSDDVNFDQILAQLKATLEKNKASALAFFEALVHNRLKDYAKLKERNDKALKIVNLIGKRLNIPHEMIQTFRRSFKLHDFFRLYVSGSVLDKNDPLSQTEQDAILKQPFLMKELMDLFDFFAHERQILLYHHENFDGSGYPEGLKGIEIPLGSQIFALVDTILAITMPSYPRETVTKENLITEITKAAGKQFDPFMVELVIKILREEEL